MDRLFLCGPLRSDRGLLHIPDSETSQSPIGVIKLTGGRSEKTRVTDATFLAFANVIQIGRGDSSNVKKMPTILGGLAAKLFAKRVWIELNIMTYKQSQIPFK